MWLKIVNIFIIFYHWIIIYNTFFSTIKVLRMIGKGSFGRYTIFNIYFSIYKIPIFFNNRVYQVFKEKYGVITAKVMGEEDFDFKEWQIGMKMSKFAIFFKFLVFFNFFLLFCLYQKLAKSVCAKIWNDDY